jgi:hypothetical protein
MKGENHFRKVPDTLISRRNAMNKTTVTKIFSTSLSLALAVTSAPIPAGAVGPTGPAAPAFVARLTPPEQFGYVASSFAPGNAERPRLIVIADLHGHVEVQKNIIGILSDVVPKIKSAHRKVPILVEGGWEPNLEEPLKAVSDPSVRSFMGQYLLQKSEINAAQAFSEKVAGPDSPVTLIGAETKEEYMANKERFAKTYPERKQLLLAIKHKEAALRALSSNITGGAYRKLQNMRDDYFAGKIRVETFSKTLVRLASRCQVSLPQADILKNPAAASSADLEVALNGAYRRVLAALSSDQPLSALWRRSLGDENNIRFNLAQVDANLDLLKRLVGNQLTPGEVPLAMAKMAELIQTAEKLVGETSGVNVAKVVRDSFYFYPFATLRDESLMVNSLRVIEQFGPEATGILVAGGFHTDSISDSLRRKGIAHLVIHPVITRDLTTEEQLNYVKRVCDEHVTADEVKADLAWLKMPASRRTAAAAIGPVSGLPGKTTEDNNKMLGGIAKGMEDQVKAMLSVDREAVAKLSHLGVQGLAEGAVLPGTAAEVSAVAEGRIYRAPKVLAGAGFGGLASLDLKGGITISRQTDESYIVEDQVASKEALGIIVNQVAQLGGAGQDADVIDLVSVKDDEAIEKLGAEARIIADSKNKRIVIVMAESRMEILKNAMARLANVPGSVRLDTPEAAALVRTLHTLVHEFGHAFGLEGQNEAATINFGIVATFATLRALRPHNTAKELADFMVFSMAKQFGLAGLGAAFNRATANGLAEWLANKINPKELRSEQVQQLVTEMQQEFPSLTEYQIQNEVQKLSGGFWTAGMAGGVPGARNRLRGIFSAWERLTAGIRKAA